MQWDIDALDKNVKQRIGKARLRYEPNPFKHAEPLKQSELGSYRFRVGDYRVMFDLEGDQIVVPPVGHRREIYKRIVPALREFCRVLRESIVPTSAEHLA